MEEEKKVKSDGTDSEKEQNNITSDQWEKMMEDQERKLPQRGVARPRGTDSAKIIKVIETKSLRGKGTPDDPCRIVRQYWSFNGKLLAENDPDGKDPDEKGKAK